MWIRSQDKRLLKECEEFDIQEETEEITIEEKPINIRRVDIKTTGKYEILSVCDYLGVYSSEEKALKVLGMIQDKIIYRDLAKDLKVNDMPADMYNEHIKKLSPVFEMPQDDEVKL